MIVGIASASLFPAFNMDDALKRFDAIRMESANQEQDATALRLLKKQIDGYLTDNFLNRSVFVGALDHPPSSISSVPSNDGVSKQSLEPPIGTAETTRVSLPAAPKKWENIKQFSSANKETISGVDYTSRQFNGDNIEIREDLQLHLEVALLLIEYHFHQNKQVQPFESPSKGLSPLSTENTRMKKTGLPETLVQTYLSRVLCRVCAVYGVTVHDARSNPKLFLDGLGAKHSGFTDFFLCYNGAIIGLIEIKVFFDNNKYFPQLVVSNIALSAGVNGSWQVAAMTKKDSKHVFGIMWNGFQLVRTETTLSGSGCKPSIICDEGALDSSKLLRGLCQLLLRATRNDISVANLSLGVGDGPNGDEHKDDEYDEHKDDERRDDVPKKKGKAANNRRGKRQQGSKADDTKEQKHRQTKVQNSTNPSRGPLLQLRPLDLLIRDFESCGDDPVAGLLGWRAVKFHTGMRF